MGFLLRVLKRLHYTVCFEGRRISVSTPRSNAEWCTLLKSVGKLEPHSHKTSPNGWCHAGSIRRHIYNMSMSELGAHKLK